MIPNQLRYLLLPILRQNLGARPNIPLPIQQVGATPRFPSSAFSDLASLQRNTLRRNALLRWVVCRAQMEKMSLATLAEIHGKRLHERPHEVIVEGRNRGREAVGVDVGANETRVDVNKTDGRVGAGEVLHAQGGHGDGVLVGVEQGEVVIEVEVGRVDGVLEAAAVDADHAAWP